jgi:hypothetical protein
MFDITLSKTVRRSGLNYRSKPAITSTYMSNVRFFVTLAYIKNLLESLKLKEKPHRKGIPGNIVKTNLTDCKKYNVIRSNAVRPFSLLKSIQTIRVLLSLSFVSCVNVVNPAARFMLKNRAAGSSGIIPCLAQTLPDFTINGVKP